MKRYKWIASLIILSVVATQWTAAQNRRNNQNVYVSTADWNKQIVQEIPAGTSLQKVLSLIEKEYNVNFLFDSKLLDEKTLSKQKLLYFNRGLFELLDRLLPEFGFTYTKLTHRTLGIIPGKPVLEKAIKLEVITGTVSDAQSGDPLPGVNVLLKGTTIGTSTGSEGTFSIDVPSLQDTLIFSFIGYQSQEVPINGRTTLNITLTPQTIAGEELVVTAFGLERETRSLTYSTENVDSESLTEARELNVVSSLSGKVAGMQVNQAGTGVGGATRVVLRGNRSISGSSQPLYVVDGVPVRGDISNMNPDIIESINVLKGPNAAALYGSEAQNGAIVVTTKKGRAGEVEISYSSNFMFRDPLLLTEYQNEYGQGTSGQYAPSSESSFGPRMEGQMVAHWSPNPEMAGEQHAFTPQPDNVRDAFQTGYNASNNLTASMGSENIQALFSYTFTNAEGVVPGNALDRHNISARVNSQLSDKLSLDSKLSYMRQSIDNQLFTGENFANPIRHIYRMPRNIRTADAKIFEYTNPEGMNRQHYWNPLSNGGANPYWTMNRNLRENVSDRVNALASLTYDFTDYLSLMVRSAYDGGSGESETRQYNDTYVIAQNGYYGISQSTGYEWNSDFLLSYNQDLTEDWYIEANLGGNIKQQRNSSISSNTNNALTIPNFFAISNTQNVVSSQNIGSPMDIYSAYAFGQVAWKDAIYLDFSGRNDVSSTLPEDNRSYFYPSVGLSASLTDLISGLPEVLSNARIRGSWAKVGNSAPPFMTIRTAELESGGNSGFLQLDTVLPNENLKPEETEAYEIGANVQFFENRLGLDFTYYKTNTRDQLFQVAVPVGSGASSFFTNGGDVSNEGYEILLNATPVQNRDFNWNLDVNYSTNENMVEKISEEQPRLTLATDFLRAFRIEEGKPFGQVYSRGWERTKDGTNRVIVGEDGIPEVTGGLTVPVANFSPDWKGSIRSTFSYKNISMSFLIDHRQGGTIASLTNAILFDDGLTKQTLKGREEGMVFGKDIFGDQKAVMRTGGTDQEPVYGENTTEVSSQLLWTSIGGRNTPVGEAFVVEATNTRLRELTLGYTLPQSLVSTLPVSNIKLSLVGRNLFFIYRASENLDPDLMTGTNAAAEGFESFTPPSSRTFGANINIDF